MPLTELRRIRAHQKYLLSITPPEILEQCRLWDEQLRAADKEFERIMRIAFQRKPRKLSGRRREEKPRLIALVDDAIKANGGFKVYSRRITCQFEAAFALLDQGFKAENVALALGISKPHSSVLQARWRRIKLASLKYASSR